MLNSNLDPNPPQTCAPQDYLKLATAGAACNAIVRFVLHPLDCVKTTVQAEMGRDRVAADEDDPDASDGWVGTVKGIVKNGGVGELTRGIDVSTVSRWPALSLQLPTAVGFHFRGCWKLCLFKPRHKLVDSGRGRQTRAQGVRCSRMKVGL